MDSQPSPLQIIKQKEVELRQMVEEARRLAAQRIEAAHEMSKRRVAEAEVEGRTEAELMYARGVEKAHQTAAEITADAKRKAQSLQELADTRREAVVRQIVGLTLPDP